MLTEELLKLGAERVSRLGEMAGVLPGDERVRTELPQILALSDFVWEQLSRNPGWLADMCAEGLLGDSLPTDTGSALARWLDGVGDDDDLRRRLRRFRNYRMVALAWQDLSGRFPISQITAALSELAEEIVTQTLDLIYRRMCTSLGTPVGALSGEDQHMLVIGMGKLGGGELNFSSDIDLIFAYPEGGCTRGGRRETDNQIFFTKTAQALIAALNQVTADGQVYRVDMRLRPFGDDGQLVSSFSALEQYYVQHGRSWERYAMVKARVLGRGCQREAEELWTMLRPFVYRRYFDFGAIDALRKMKAMIEAEVRRRGFRGNIKLGQGGIREVEFVTQVFQLMRGGREPELQQRGLMAALEALEHSEVISRESSASLQAGYCFLRKLENVLQEIADRQTQELPEDELNRQRAAAAMGFASFADLERELTRHCDAVHGEFREVVKDQTCPDEGVEQLWIDIWRSNLSAGDVAPLLGEYTSSADDFARDIVDFRQDVLRRAAGPVGRETLNLLMPRLLSLVSEYDGPELLFARVSSLIRSIITRTTYLQLLYENRNVLDQVIYLCSASNKIADQLSSYPILLDELLYPDSLYQISTDAGRLRSELRQHMLRVEGGDLEQKMEILRQFKQIQLLKISASDIVGRLPLMRVSDFLTELAEAVLTELVGIAWNEQVARYGEPPYAAEDRGRGFVAVAYGKLGGIELGYGSDLDLVFLHYSCAPDEMTTGSHPVTVRKFYARLVQRIIHLFSIRTSTGILYDIDLRLRPDGDSGLLVSSISSFERYQMNDAWTWEHQALVRARPVCGDTPLAEEFARVRRMVLSRSRDRERLKTEVAEMRARMRSHNSRDRADAFDLKQGRGGMVDIEFLAQYMVLAHAVSHPDILCRWSDNVRIFDSCVECGILAPETAAALKRAYVDIRNEAHRRNLRGEPLVTPAGGELDSGRDFVIGFWDRIFGGTGGGETSTTHEAQPSGA